MPKVKVNDRVVEVPPGTSAMDAIFHAGYDVPLFCAERHLSPTGSCRMCLVKAGAPRKGPDGEWIKDESGEVKIFWFPKLMASCTLAVSDGMVIDTLSDEVRHAQSGMVELTLANHPLDCPTCDKGGACDLQDRAYEYGLDKKFYTGPTGEPVYTRYEFTKRHVDKHHPLSEFIILDRERCIHCKRCVRYFEEIPGDQVLDFIERGVHTFIGTADEGLPSNFTGNIPTSARWARCSTGWPASAAVTGSSSRPPASAPTTPPGSTSGSMPAVAASSGSAPARTRS